MLYSLIRVERIYALQLGPGGECWRISVNNSYDVENVCTD